MDLQGPRGPRGLVDLQERVAPLAQLVHQERSGHQGRVAPLGLWDPLVQAVLRGRGAHQGQWGPQGRWAPLEPGAHLAPVDLPAQVGHLE